MQDFVTPDGDYAELWTADLDTADPTGHTDVVVPAGEEFAGGGPAVATGATDFLGVVFERLGEVVVDDAADVGLVDAHAKRDGGGDDGRFARHEGLLAGGAGFIAEPGVVGPGGNVVALEEGGQGLGGFLLGPVDDGGGGGIFAEAFEEGPAFVRFQAGGDPELQIGAMERELGVIGFRDLEVASDVGGHFRSSGGGEGEDAGDPEIARKLGELEVVRTKVVSPLRDAVRFIDGEKRNVRAGEPVPEVLVGEPFRSDVEHGEGASAHLVIDRVGFLSAEGGVESCGGDVAISQGIDLILHEGDEGRDHQSEPVEENGRKLVAERLAAPGGKDRERWAICEEGLDDLFLAAAEFRKAEAGLEGGGEVGHGHEVRVE